MSKKYPGVSQDKKRGTYFYSIKYRDNTGKIKNTFTRGFPNAKDCYIAKEAKKKELDKEIQLGVSSCDLMTFKQLEEEFYQENVLKNKQRTANVYRERLEFLIPHLGNKYFKRISVKEIQETKQKLLKDGFSRGYINIIMTAANIMFNYAIRIYGLEFNVVKKSGDLKVDKIKEEMKVWDYNEFKKFINAVEDLRWKTFFTFLYLTGARKGEAQALTWNDINFSTNKVNIDATYYIEDNKEHNTLPKTRNSIRKVTLDKETITIFKELYILDSSIKLFKSSDYIFIKNGRPFAEKTIDGTKDRIIAKVGVIRITCHEFRHSHVSYLISLGASIPYIAKRIGDTIETIYKTYAHMLPSEEQEVINKMDNNYSKIK